MKKEKKSTLEKILVVTNIISIISIFILYEDTKFNYKFSNCRGFVPPRDYEFCINKTTEYTYTILTILSKILLYVSAIIAIASIIILIIMIIKKITKKYNKQKLLNKKLTKLALINIAILTIGTLIILFIPF